MQPADDLELLRRYAREKCERSFAELVTRHLDLVYSVAMRQVRSPEAAKEVSQAVFIELARSAGRFELGTVLPAWLYEVTRRRSIDHIRRESRRRVREQIACETHAMTSNTNDWTSIEPLLDEAMDSLDRTDRAAILLRFFENRSLREVGQALGVSDDAAQKRVSRAVDRLREFFAKKRLPVAAAGLAAVISTNAVQAAPIGLASTISASALATGAAVATTTAAAKLMSMPLIQNAVISAAFAATVGVGIYQTNHVSQLAAKVNALEQTQQQASTQNSQSGAAIADLNDELSALKSENAQLRTQNEGLQSASVQLQQTKAHDTAAANDQTRATMNAWLDRVAQLKRRFAQNPSQAIPEMQLLKDDDWLNAARGNFVTEADYRKGMSAIRSIAENKFAPMLQVALKNYMDANNNQFPQNTTQLQPFLPEQVDPRMLQHYTIEPASDYPNLSLGGDSVITEANLTDPDNDLRKIVGPKGQSLIGSMLLVGGPFGTQTLPGNASTSMTSSVGGQQIAGGTVMLSSTAAPGTASVQRVFRLQTGADGGN